MRKSYGILNFFMLFSLFIQNIVAYEYLPAFLSASLEPYTGYKADMHPGITHVFQSAAFRFGHTLIPPGIYRRDNQCHFKKTADDGQAIRLCSSWWDSEVNLCSLYGHALSSPFLEYYFI